MPAKKKRSGTNLTLAEIKSGAVEEQFAAAVKEVLANIADPNTKPTTKRRIDIRVVFMPNKTRTHADIDATVVPVIAGRVPVQTAVNLVMHGTEMVAREPRQLTDPDMQANVIPIDKGEK